MKYAKNIHTYGYTVRPILVSLISQDCLESISPNLTQGFPRAQG